MVQADRNGVTFFGMTFFLLDDLLFKIASLDSVWETDAVAIAGPVPSITERHPTQPVPPVEHDSRCTSVSARLSGQDVLRHDCSQSFGLFASGLLPTDQTWCTSCPGVRARVLPHKPTAPASSQSTLTSTWRHGPDALQPWLRPWRPLCEFSLFIHLRTVQQNTVYTRSSLAALFSHTHDTPRAFLPPPLLTPSRHHHVFPGLGTRTV